MCDSFTFSFVVEISARLRILDVMSVKTAYGDKAQNIRLKAQLNQGHMRGGRDAGDQLFHHAFRYPSVTYRSWSLFSACKLPQYLK